MRMMLTSPLPMDMVGHRWKIIRPTCALLPLVLRTVMTSK
jgi:hypothetical protein